MGVGHEQLGHGRNEKCGHRSVLLHVGQPPAGIEAGQEPPGEPPRIGPVTRRAPLVVENGEQTMKPRPLQWAGTAPG